MSETHLQQGGVVTRDILTDIDALIDSQLAAGEPEGGYDYDDPGYPRCWHCSEPWHGLAITVRMRAMRWVGAIDPDYRYDEDDSRGVKSGVPFESVIAWGIEPGAQITMDRNRKRTLIDHLRIMGEHSTKELATVLNLSVAWDRGDRLSIGHQTKVEYEEAYQYLLDYPAIRSSLAYVEMLGISRVRKVVNPAHLAFIHWVLSCIDQADADDFVEKVVSGQYVESDNEATHRLHVRLRDLRVGRMDKSYEVVPLAMKGWNLYRTGVLTKQLRIRRGGSAPEAFPEPQ